MAMPAKLSATAGLAILVATVAIAQQPWVSERTSGTAQDLNTVSFVDSRTGWVGGDGGTVLRTEDGGGSWSAQRLNGVQTINDIYFANRREGYLLAGNQILATSDSGRTWQVLIRMAGTEYGGEPELNSIHFTTRKKGWIVGSISRDERVLES